MLYGLSLLAAWDPTTTSNKLIKILFNRVLKGQQVQNTTEDTTAHSIKAQVMGSSNLAISPSVVNRDESKYVADVYWKSRRYSKNTKVTTMLRPF